MGEAGKYYTEHGNPASNIKCRVISHPNFELLGFCV